MYNRWIVLSILMVWALILTPFIQASEVAVAVPRGLTINSMPPEDGYTEWKEGEPGIHFRIEENRLLVFLLDETGVIHAPNLHAASILLVGQMNQGATPREFLPLYADPSWSAYTAARLVRPPHIFTATLYLFDKDQPEATRIFNFRFNAVADQQEPGRAISP
jgi:hypothetical protein